MRTSSEPAASGSAWEQELRRFVQARREIFYLKTDIQVPDELLKRLAVGREPEFPFTWETVAAACRDALGGEPSRIEPLRHQGTFHRLLRARIRDGEEVIFRINVLSDLFRDFQLWINPWISRTLRQRGVPCVEVLAADATRRVVPFDFEVVRPAAGVCLRELDSDEPRILEELGRLGEVVARMHQVRTSGFGFLDPSPFVRGKPDARGAGMLEGWADYVLLNLSRHVRTCVDIGVLAPAKADRIETLFEQLEPMLRDVRPSLLHGDLGSHNVFTDGQEITGLIDLDDCLSGDPVFDIALWATFHPPRRHRAFLDGYKRGASLPRDFAPRFWLYFLRAALSKTVHRYRFGYQDQPGRSPASRRITDGLDGLETALADKGAST